MKSPKPVPPENKASSKTENRLFLSREGIWLQTSQKRQHIKVSRFTPPFRIEEYLHPDAKLSLLISEAAEVEMRRIGPRFVNRPITDRKGPKVEVAGIEILRLLENMADSQEQSAGLGYKIIPRTCLRRFYSFLRDFPQTEVHIPLAEYVANQSDGIVTLDRLFGHSVERCEGYDNGEPFHRKRPNEWRPRADAHAKHEKRKAVDLITKIGEFRASGPFSVSSAKDLDFTALSYEVSPLRTTGTKYEDETSGRRSGAGGMDLLLSSADRRVPVVGEVKAPGDTSLFTALVQSLTYASELVTVNQHKRLLTSYGAAFDPTRTGVCCDIYILYFSEDKPDLQKEAMTIADCLMALPDGAVAKRVRRIAFIETSLGGRLPSFECRHVSPQKTARSEVEPASGEKKASPKPGSLTGFRMAPDFDEPLEDLKEYME